LTEGRERMISWMQKHNKYLVWTIWIATIAFIGAGFVGWGSYNFGSKAGSVAKVGEVEISRTKLNIVYGNLYNRYNEMLQGTLDDKKAQEMGLVKQAFKQLQTQATILNFAQELGIVVSNEEIIEKIETIKGFQKEGLFNKEIYMQYLKAQRIKASAFEDTLKEELILQKTLSLLDSDAFKLETDAIFTAMNIADKLAYKPLDPTDVNITLDETKMEAFWEVRKENFMTPKMYKLNILWTNTQDTNVTDTELRAYFNLNRFNYSESNGTQLTFEKAKRLVSKDLKLKKRKKSAQKSYIAFKKSKRNADETVTLSLGDERLSMPLWEKLKEASKGDVLKPKVVGSRYATVRVEEITLPKVKSYQEAKEEITLLYKEQATKEALQRLANNYIKNFDANEMLVSDFVNLEQDAQLEGFNGEESLQFLEKLFISNKEKGMIALSNKVVVYAILEQKIVPIDQNKTNLVIETTNKLKQSVFESNLIKMLHDKYPTEVYMGGLIN